MFKHPLTFLVVFFTLASCATVDAPMQSVEAPVSRDVQIQAQREQVQPQKKMLKRKIAIGRFTNESRYGASLLRDGELDPLGKQVSDMLMARLIDSGRFLVFERQDLGRLEREQAIIAGKSGKKQSVIDVNRNGSDENNTDTKIAFSSDRTDGFSLIGVDALVLGSLTEFSRKTTGKSGFLSGTKMQTAEAKVEIRLADPMTGHAFFSATGHGSANTESGRVAGFGSKASYDGSLNDKAIAAAISDLTGELIAKLESRPWRAGVLKADGNVLYISGGERQGLKVGDVLSLMQEAESIQSDNGFAIQLPPKRLGTVKVISLFGDAETNEGAIVQIVSGAVGNGRNIFVAEVSE